MNRAKHDALIAARAELADHRAEASRLRAAGLTLSDRDADRCELRTHVLRVCELLDHLDRLTGHGIDVASISSKSRRETMSNG